MQWFLFQPRQDIPATMAEDPVCADLSRHGPGNGLREITPSQDEGHDQVVYGTDADADGRSLEQQAVEQVRALFLVAAGTQDQAAAGGEGADGRALSAQDRAGEQGDGA